ncbi:hypothetical protein PsYK624_044680 [Phanerochaete sordida]|uniref:Zinc-finger domain-containing protein n=1 Tax=Phanerochaete sordida TaxID=48140 RepID=A0A9P3G5U8_9APHY|nr:hypothetical protein PsYK624_044680 [Phanerochaete sordida]
MSGPTAVQQPSGSSQESSTTPAADPAAELRAAALKTLKSKRRKGADGPDAPAALPPRPLSTGTPSIQLDYGSEDPYAKAPPVSAATPTAAPPPAAAKPAPPAPPPPAPGPMDVDDDLREEGEISDSESMPPPKSPQVSRQAPPPAPAKQAKDRAMPPPIVPPSPTVSVKTETSSHLLYDPPASSINSSPSIPRYSPLNDYDTYAIDEDHVRPGLAMTQAQYDTAKDIVLDLLGWGVQPEYLVDCGLSREIIYFVFLELNLRLPANLDTAGLPPPPWQSRAYASPEPMPPPTLSRDPQRQRGTLSSRLSVSDPHPSLPKKPIAPQGTSPRVDTTPLSATAAPFVPNASLSALPMQSDDAPATPSLIDMEQQRRQELLARKAVLASRKKQVAASASSSSAAPLKDVKEVTPTPTVAPAAVDDFLKSIGPVSSSVAPPSRSTPPEADDPMDVDDQIPGLSAGDIPGLSQLPGPSVPRASSSESMAGSGLAIPPPPESEGSIRSTSVERNGIASDGSSSGSGTPQPPSLGSRRGTKRPVAADFVDMDSRPHPYHHHHYHHHPQPALRRKTNSFAGITQTRRIVIDLSDSEEEVEEAVNGYRPPSVSQQPTRPPTRLATPAALEQKEQEIKRMREMIAERERARLSKLTANSNRSTPAASTSGTPIPQTPAPMKEEEEDTRMVVSAKSVTTIDIHRQSSTDSSTNESPLSATTAEIVTPIDIPHTFEHSATGDQVLTAEAHQEHVARMSSPDDDEEQERSPTPSTSMAVDVVDSLSEASTAQVSIVPPSSPSPSSRFPTYRSPLSAYPLLRSRSPPQLLDIDSSAETAPHHSDLSVLSPVSLSSLKAAAINRWLSDPSRRVCQYEVPGGGECRDPNCEDIHPSRTSAAEPTDEETAQHLHSALPKGSEVGVAQLTAALQDFRRQNLGFEARVKQALASLGLRMAA